MPTKAELIEEAEALGLDTSGTKADISARIEAETAKEVKVIEVEPEADAGDAVLTAIENAETLADLQAAVVDLEPAVKNAQPYAMAVFQATERIVGQTVPL